VTLRALRDVVPDRAKVAYADLMHRMRWRRSPVARGTLQFVRHHGLTVRAGPFKGMVYPKFAVGRGELVVAQLLGAYECEIAPAIERVIECGFEQIVDIGASDGYYAVGLARASPQSTVYAFEMNPFPARVCRALAQANNVEDRLVLEGECRLDDLRRLPDRESFVLCDCEGCEAQLMDPEAVPLLRRASLIVELHAFAVPDVEATIVDRFSPSHSIEIVDTGSRNIGEYADLLEVPGITYMDREVVLSEFRPHAMKWAVMQPRTG
jgi:hypothetical protein